MYPSRIVNLLQAINVNVDSLFNFSSSEVLYMYICRAGFRVHTRPNRVSKLYLVSSLQNDNSFFFFFFPLEEL